ncbi:endonuclease/exonuclease/phosphatase family protein [Nonomuraea sp. NPDC001636]|uniref:endonuclease/exonuclease/phosphatase family protein n=1 Tax=Nonomuraea sp. NPDC001636 TaxID=3154391 RepID=UPI003331E3C0
MTIPRGPAIMLALGLVLLLDVLRVFLPSLITLFGRAGETPPELMGLYAAAWFILPFLALLAKPRHALLGGAAALVLTRILLQAGVSQLYVASAGVTAGLVFLYGCAHTVPRRAVPVGVMGGLSLSLIVHLLLDGVDLVWRDGLVPWLAVLCVCAAFLSLVRPPAAEVDRAPALTWFLLGPAMLLTGVAATGWAKPEQSPTDLWQMLAGTGLLAAVLVMAVVQAARPPLSPVFDLIIGVLLVAFTVLLTLSAPYVAVLLIGWLGALLAGTARPDYPAGRRPGVAVLGGGLVFFVGLFVYYAAYDMNLGFPNGQILVAVAVLVAALSVITALVRHSPPPAGPVRLNWLPPAVAVLLVGLVTLGAPSAPPVRAKQGDTFTLIAYNIRMGYGLDGRLSLDKIGTWAAAQKPDVVLLSEVDRGWLLNGGHDDLARIARRLGMRYHFAPAADQVWGDALLTNLPVKQVHSHPLGAHDYPTGAQAQTVVLEVGGREVGIVNTHLQAPEGQAPEVAAIARALAAGRDADEAGHSAAGAGEQVRRPVVLAGDLNTRPTDPAMEVLKAAGLSDPLTAFGDPPTSPADAPKERIDHVLLTKGLTAISAQAPRLPYSDHLPVLTTLRLTSVDQEG